MFTKLSHKYFNCQRMLAKVLTELMDRNQLPLKHPEGIPQQIFTEHPPSTRHKGLSREQNSTSYSHIAFSPTGVILRVAESGLLCAYNGSAAVTSTQQTCRLSSPVLYSISPRSSSTISLGSENPQYCQLSPPEYPNALPKDTNSSYF